MPHLQVSYNDTYDNLNTALVAKFMGPIWGPSGAARTQMGPMNFAIWVASWGGLPLMLAVLNMVTMTTCPICIYYYIGARSHAGISGRDK